MGTLALAWWVGRVARGLVLLTVEELAAAVSYDEIYHLRVGQLPHSVSGLA